MPQKRNLGCKFKKGKIFKVGGLFFCFSQTLTVGDKKMQEKNANLNSCMNQNFMYNTY